MGDHANKDEGTRCLHIAEQALQAGDLTKATRFAEKAMRLFPNDEVLEAVTWIGVWLLYGPSWH